MNQTPFNLGDKKERNDFLIALTVIVFFGILFWWLFFNNKPVDLPKIVKENVPAVIVDADGDGINDEDDKCPLIAGVTGNNGCPLDTDGDGIYDTKDKCPTYAGSLENNGCPPDGDADGIHDGLDKCPKLPGIKKNKGCPADSDGDGVYDTVDRCPNKPGLPKNNGCPEIKIDETEQLILETAVKEVKFETGSAVLKSTSMTSLNQVVALMKKYPAFKIKINGHTDSQGDSAMNLSLSKERAQAAKTYLTQNDIRAQRIIANGFGSRVPVDTNDTARGRQNNRRIEFDLSY